MNALIALLMAANSLTAAHSASSNWSGYGFSGGPFTSVSGTFDVAGPLPGPACGDDVSEWIGIDGMNNNDLIQAGVNETGACTGEAMTIQTWWEILPGPEEVLSLPVQVGDEVTVTIDYISNDRWHISMMDDSTTLSWGSYFPYNGPATSAEWVVEAPTQFGGVTTVMPFTPVAWSDLTLDGPADLMSRIWLRQDKRWMAIPNWVPSADYLMAHGFQVEYAGG